MSLIEEFTVFYRLSIEGKTTLDYQTLHQQPYVQVYLNNCYFYHFSLLTRKAFYFRKTWKGKKLPSIQQRKKKRNCFPHVFQANSVQSSSTIIVYNVQCIYTGYQCTVIDTYTRTCNSEWSHRKSMHWTLNITYMHIYIHVYTHRYSIAYTENSAYTIQLPHI